MKRSIAGLAVLVSMVPVVGHATSGSCTGLAPVIASCQVTFVASGSGSESGASLGRYEGTLHAVASSPSGGRIEIDCESRLLNFQRCGHRYLGDFRAGETVTLVATASGIGYWTVSVTA